MEIEKLRKEFEYWKNYKERFEGFERQMVDLKEEMTKFKVYAAEQVKKTTLLEQKTEVQWRLIHQDRIKQIE